MKDLVLITNFYPAEGKENFLIEEVPILAKKFNNIFIFPLNNAKTLVEIPSNVMVLNFLNAPVTKYEKIGYLLKNLGTYLKLIGFGMASSNSSLLLKLGVLSNRLISWMKKKDKASTLFYSYWLDEGATILGLFKEKSPNSYILSRAHGYDLYEEDYPQGLPLFYQYSIKQMNEICFISENGKNYFAIKFQNNKSIKTISYLGTKDLGKAKYPDTNTAFKIATCSSIIPLKRLPFLAKALALLDLNLEWHHFGDGPERQEVEDAVKGKKTIKLFMHGFVNNDDLLNIYKKMDFHLFINVSRTEGLPVSFGIPLLATDVRGTSEVCNSNTGILVDKNIDVKELAHKICQALMKEWDRDSIRRYWNENFNAKVNFEKFANYLVEIQCVE